MAVISVICKKCTKEFICDTEDQDGVACFRSPDSKMAIIERCKHCGYANRIVIPSSEV